MGSIEFWQIELRRYTHAGIDHPLLSDRQNVVGNPIQHQARWEEEEHHAEDERHEPHHLGQDDVVHAAHLQRDVLLLPIGLGAVLDYQQHFVDRSAMGDQYPHGCTAAVQSAKIQLSPFTLTEPLLS